MIRNNQTVPGDYRRGHIMKRTISLTLILVLALSTMVAQEAGAGWLDKFKGKKKKDEVSAHRYDLFATMSYHKGVLGQGAGQTWQLDDAEIQVQPDCVVSSELDGAESLSAGQEVIIIGTRFGDTIIAHQVRMVKPDYMNNGFSKTSKVTPSEVDPTVGVGTGPE